MQECSYDIKLWVSSFELKLNDGKTETMIVSSQRMSTSLPMPDSFTFGTSNVKFSQPVKILDVMLDTQLTKKNQFATLVGTANFELRRISSIRHYFFCRSCTEARLSLCHVQTRLL